MNLEAKKIAAALAAVDMYLAQEAAQSAAQAPGRPTLFPSLWALSGRQAIMNNRALVAARVWK